MQAISSFSDTIFSSSFLFSLSLLFVEDIQNIRSCPFSLSCSPIFLFWLQLLFPLGPPHPYPCCGLSCCTPHSQDSLLPLCLHTFMPAVVTDPPLPRLPRSGSFLLLFSPPDPTHLPHMGLGSRKLFPSGFSISFHYFQAAFFDYKSSNDREPSIYVINHLFIHTHYARSFLLLKFTFMPAAAAGPPGSTAWM